MPNEMIKTYRALNHKQMGREAGRGGGGSGSPSPGARLPWVFDNTDKDS